jgi:hypothetical protein
MVGRHLEVCVCVCGCAYKVDEDRRGERRYTCTWCVSRFIKWHKVAKLWTTTLSGPSGEICVTNIRRLVPFSSSVDLVLGNRERSGEDALTWGSCICILHFLIARSPEPLLIKSSYTRCNSWVDKTHTRTLLHFLTVTILHSQNDRLETHTCSSRTRNTYARAYGFTPR